MGRDRPLEILFVVHGYPPARGGTEHAVAELARRLVADHGDSVRVFTGDALAAGGFTEPRAPRLPAGTDEIDGVEVRRFRSVRTFGPVLRQLQRVAWRFRTPFHEQLRTLFQGPILPDLERSIRETRADVVVASAFPLLHMYAALRAAHASGRPCVLLPALHPDDVWGFDRSMIDRALCAADACLVYTEFEHDHVLDRGVSAERVRVLGLGVDAESLACGDRAAMRAQLGVPGDAALIGFLGQLAPHKGADVLLQAMASLWESHPQAHCLLAGATTGFRSDLERVVAAFPADQRERIHWRSDFPESEKADLLAALDILAAPSRFESFGLVLLEAWAAGKPVVAGAIPAVSSLVRDGETGLLVPPADRAALAAALARLLDDPAAAAQMGAAGQREVQEQRSWKAVTARLRDELRSVAG